MRKTLLAAFALALTPAFAQDYWCLNRVISLTGEYTYLRRQQLRDLRLAEEVPEAQAFDQSLKGKKVLDTEDLEERLDWESGFRGGVTIHWNECFSLEFLYTYVNPWKAKEVKKAKEGQVLRFPFKDHRLSIDYATAKRVEAKYNSRLQNGEINLWKHVTPQRYNYFSFSWDFGLRMVWLNEAFEMVFSRPMSSSDYQIDTRNHLYGFQLGAMLEVNPSQCWTWTFMIKGAGFVNLARNKVCIRDEDNQRKLREYKKERATSSGLIEGYGQLAYHLNSCLSVQLGYQGYLLAGLALAPTQRDVSVNTRRRISRKGQIVIDGLYAGIELNF